MKYEFTPIIDHEANEQFEGSSSAAVRGVTKHRTIFISDIHLGSVGAQCDFLLDFLKHNNCDKLYLVGDVIDGWRLRKRWFWPQPHNDVIQKILRKARHGTEVIYLPGNHDEFARQYFELSFGGILVKDSDIHKAADGRKYWVVHGDLFDGVMQHARWLAYAGDFAYTILLKVNRWLSIIRRMLNLPYWSFSQYLKHRVKSAVSFISAFETAMITETKRLGCDGVICGHIHKPELTKIDEILYANTGDWVESATALVEDYNGNLKILYWGSNMTSQSDSANNRNLDFTTSQLRADINEKV